MTRHLLDFKNIEKKGLEKLIDITEKINPEKLNKISSISLLKFDEPSTRTRLSFSVAAHRLGIKTIESSDLISAKIKGENLDHEIETYKALGIDSIVIRTEEENLDEYREFKDISFISAGFGTVSHPTQAVVDATTLKKFGKLENDIPVVYTGDVKHSRVFKSGKELFTALGKKVGVFTHKSFLPDDLSNIRVLSSWEEVLDSTDAIEVLRVQGERINNFENLNLKDFVNDYQLTDDILNKSDDNLIVLHPMPMNLGVEISEQASKHDKFKYKDQLSFGIASRISSYMYVMEKYDWVRKFYWPSYTHKISRQQ